MKKLAPFLLGLVLLAWFGGKNAYDFVQEQTYLAKTDGYAAAKAKYTQPAPAASNAIAQSICTGSFATDAASLFDPSMGVTQADLDAFTAGAQSSGHKCVEVSFLGSVQNADGSTDDIYRIVTNERALWYAFTLNAGLITNIQ